MFDVAICMLSGILGFVMKKRGWPAIALVLGFLLADALERSLRQSLGISGGNIGILVQSPIAKGIAITNLVLLTIAIYSEVKRKKKNASDKVGA
jgi:putative tricarboxylic transport membrane protein